jgi:hypothetical protein
MYSINQQVLGLAKESVRGTAESTPSKWIPTRGKTELDLKLMHLMDEGIRGTFSKFPPIAGIKAGDGKIPLYFDAQLMPEFFYSLLGTVTSAEDTTVTISASNKYINFNIGGGELTATVATGTYAIGLTQADAGSLCKAIYDAIVAAEAVGTYTVSYSRSTKLFTIARSAGTFQLKFLTGTNNAASIDTTLGYTHTDKTGAITYTGATQVEYAFTHTIVNSSSLQKPAYTYFLDRGLNVLKYNRGVVKKMSIKGGVDNLIEAEADVLFENEASGSIGSTSFPTQRFLGFQSVDFKIAGSSNTSVKEWELDIDNTSVPHRALTGSQVLQDIIAAGKLGISGGFTIYFENATERDKFIANTAVAIRVLCQGSTIVGSSKWAIDMNIYEAHYKAFPYTEESGLLAAKASFEGFYSSSDSKDFQVALTNQYTSY